MESCDASQDSTDGYKSVTQLIVTDLKYKVQH